MALLPSKTINFTIGFDLGTTLFAWIFGPFFLQEKSLEKNIPNIKKKAFKLHFAAGRTNRKYIFSWDTNCDGTSTISNY